MKILDAILHAIQNGAILSDISKFIVDKPTLTSDGNGRSVATHADYAPDPEHEKHFIKFWEYKDFIYWKVRNTDYAVVIVGIAWDDENKSKLFHAWILPPG